MSKETVSSKFCKAAIKLTNVVDNVMWPKFLRSSLNDWKNRPLLSTVNTVGAVCWMGVWGDPSYMKTWRATDNAIEGIANLRNDT